VRSIRGGHQLKVKTTIEHVFPHPEEITCNDATFEAKGKGGHGKENQRRVKDTSSSYFPFIRGGRFT
jgi:hypothetical protein